MDYKSVFKMPKPMNITRRSSTITNSFINAIIPSIRPTDNEIKKALEILGMTPDTVQCAYCGSESSEWDHLRPLVKDKRPTGYISEIRNLVPSCGKCNQSKRNVGWREWIVSGAPFSPKSKGVTDLDERIEHLVAYENWGIATKMNFEEIVGKTVWDQHWANWEKLTALMYESQELAARINKSVLEAYNKSK